MNSAEPREEVDPRMRERGWVQADSQASKTAITLSKTEHMKRNHFDGARITTLATHTPENAKVKQCGQSRKHDAKQMNSHKR